MIRPLEPMSLCPGCEFPKAPGRRCVRCSEADEVLAEVAARRAEVGAAFDDPEAADPSTVPSGSSPSIWTDLARGVRLDAARSRLWRRRSS